jgi:hypothetical protein
VCKSKEWKFIFIQQDPLNSYWYNSHAINLENINLRVNLLDQIKVPRKTESHINMN